MLYHAYEGEINVNPDAVRKGSFKSGRNEEAQRRKRPQCGENIAVSYRSEAEEEARGAVVRIYKNLRNADVCL